MTDLQIQGVNMDLARKENENKLLNKSGVKRQIWHRDDRFTNTES